jgi:hypothetical protein
MPKASYVWRAGFKTRLAAELALIADLEENEISEAETPIVRSYLWNCQQPRKFLIQLSHAF